jgi:hypothetical protein
MLLGLIALVLLAAPFRLPPHPSSRQSSLTLSGQVFASDGPAAGARVRLKSKLASVQTDSAGRFHVPAFPALEPAARVTAWMPGYFIGGASAGEPSLRLQLSPLPTVDFEPYDWVSPTPNSAASGNCGNCHEAIYREWSASAHARSASNRHFLNFYDGSDWLGRGQVSWNLKAENPDGVGVCTACHAPTVGFDDEAYFDLPQARGVAAQGVHCDYCHKVADVANQRIGLTHGRFGLKLLRPAKGQLFFGPLDDVDRGEDAYAPVYQESRYCASCHEGIVFGVPVYTTYSEWLQSPARQAGKHCQSCHTAPTGQLTNLAPGKGGIERDPATLGNHRFFNGSLEDMLRRSLHVVVQRTSPNETGRAVVDLRADQVGHRVPTGFVDRNLLLVVEGFDASGAALQPAPVTPLLPPLAGKNLAGLPGKLYAKRLTDFSGRQPAPFWRAAPEVIDTRLFPEQVEKSVYSFQGHLVRLRVRIIYRRFWAEVAEAKGWPDNDLLLVDQIWSGIPFRPDTTSATASPP